MSKLIYIRARRELEHRIVETLGRISRRLAPDHLNAWPPVLHHNGLLAYAVTSPTDAMHASGDSVLLGCMFGSTAAWSTPDAETPDGSYALVRSDEAVVEAVSDPAGSRTIWTFVDDKVFVCATSQRAILMIVGDLAFDERVVPWMLSTGTLGPECSWDRRIQRLPPGSTLSLDCREWRTTLKTDRILFAVRAQSLQQQRSDLRSALEETFGAEWSCRSNSLVVPLSGGYDSRTVLCLLQRSRGSRAADLQTITWPRCRANGTRHRCQSRTGRGGGAGRSQPIHRA